MFDYGNGTTCEGGLCGHGSSKQRKMGGIGAVSRVICAPFGLFDSWKSVLVGFQRPGRRIKMRIDEFETMIRASLRLFGSKETPVSCLLRFAVTTRQGSG